MLGKAVRKACMLLYTTVAGSWLQFIVLTVLTILHQACDTGGAAGRGTKRGRGGPRLSAGGSRRGDSHRCRRRRGRGCNRRRAEGCARAARLRLSHLQQPVTGAIVGQRSVWVAVAGMHLSWHRSGAARLLLLQQPGVSIGAAVSGSWARFRAVAVPGSAANAVPF